jgi:large subunit ribosomal protein L4e
MAKIKIMTKENGEAGSIELPQQFSEELRTDLITRSIHAIQAASRQPYGGYGKAGMRASAKLSRRRRDYRGSYGKGISRVPRKIMTRRGRNMNWVGAVSPGTVGGRRAHPPKPFAHWDQKVNTSENRKAIRSAMAATMHKDIITARGHFIPPTFPFIIDNDFESITKTADLEAALVKLGFTQELERAGVTRIRAGRGKARGRRYKTPTSILFVVANDALPVVKAVSNLPGTEVVAVHRVNAELLAPGTHPGRLTLYTKAAVERLASEGLFTTSYKGKSTAKPAKVAAPKAEKLPKTIPKKTAPKVVRVPKKRN